MSFLETEFGLAPWNRKLKLLRVLNGLTMDEVAGLCKTDKSIYCNWENGKYYPRSNSIQAIKRAFNLSDAALKEIFG